MPEANYKYAHFDYVCHNTNDFVRSILDQAPIQGKHKHVLVDVKVQHLTPEKHSCIPGWHLDGPENPLHNSLPDVHHLFVIGGGSTEFIDEPVTLYVEKEHKQKEIVAKIPDTVKVREIEQECFNTFTRFDFHRGILAKKSLTRLLIRVSETDVIRPSFQPAKNLYNAA
jgi:hypothetical protein